MLIMKAPLIIFVWMGPGMLCNTLKFLKTVPPTGPGGYPISHYCIWFSVDGAVTIHVLGLYLVNSELFIIDSILIESYLNPQNWDITLLTIILSLQST